MLGVCVHLRVLVCLHLYVRELCEYLGLYLITCKRLLFGIIRYILEKAFIREININHVIQTAAFMRMPHAHDTVMSNTAQIIQNEYARATPTVLLTDG